MALLFIHGAGAYGRARPIADALGAALGVPVRLPRLPDDDMSLDRWAERIRDALDALEPPDVVVAHSFGASVLLQVLADRTRPLPRRAVLLAMPDWSADGWGVQEYAFDGPEPAQALSLHHCRDDEIVPFSHLASNVSRLPSATVHPHDTGGHWFDGLTAAIVADLRGELTG